MDGRGYSLLMTEPRAEPLLRFANAISRGDVESALEVCHPDIEFLSVLAVSGRAYVGHAGIRQYFRDVASAWAEWRVEVHRTAPLPDGRVGILMTMHFRGKESGAMLAERTAHIWTLQDGLLRRNEPIRRAEMELLDQGS
jgi:ketosteroid isomerase-like protein